MIEEVEKKKQEPYSKKNRFKAKKVPAHVKKPLFDQIMRDNEERRQKVKQNSIAITLEREKPFTFYNRDKNKKGPKMKEDPYKEWESY